MVFPETDWVEAKPESENLDSVKLDAALGYLAEVSGGTGTEEVTVIRNGTMVWRGEHIDRKHSIASCTKAFVGTLCGLLIDDDKCDLDDRVVGYVPHLRCNYPEYGQIRLHHFLTHTSGYNAQGGAYHTDNLDGGKTPWLANEPHFLPGTRFGYWDDAVNLSGIVLTRVAGEGICDLFRRRITEPIGIERSSFSWRHLAELDGSTVHDCAGGVSTTARAFARFGLLFLNRGNWAGVQLVNPDWIEQATTNKVSADLPLSYYTAADCRGMHGYHWWLNGIRPNGEHCFPDAPNSTFFTVGTGHNMLFVIPEWQMVIVRLGCDRPCPTVEERLGIWRTVLGRVGEALR